METARLETARQHSWTGDIRTALLDGRLLDGRQLDSVAGQETGGHLEWRLLDGRQVDSVAGQETSEQRCWTGDSWTALLDRKQVGTWSGDC